MKKYFKFIHYFRVGVRLGEHKITTKIDCSRDNEYCADPVQDILINKPIRHPKYDNIKKINDIALLPLKSPADVTGRYVKTICLPITQETQIESLDELARNKMTITGWGKIESGKQSDVLLKAYIPYVKNDACAKRFVGDNIPVYDTYLCAGGKNKTDVSIYAAWFCPGNNLLFRFQTCKILFEIWFFNSNLFLKFSWNKRQRRFWWDKIDILSNNFLTVLIFLKVVRFKLMELCMKK